MFLTYLIRFLLIWWILSVIFRWVGKLGSSKNKTGTVAGGKHESSDISNIPLTGNIEDADFEEIDDN